MDTPRQWKPPKKSIKPSQSAETNVRKQPEIIPENIDPRAPVSRRAGSLYKIEVMRLRKEIGLPLYNPLDGCKDE